MSTRSPVNEINLERVIGPSATEIFSKIGMLATEQGLRAYLVGGVVRDILLSRTAKDFDVMIEGDAPEFVALLAQRWSDLFPHLPEPRKPVVFKRYRTVKLSFAANLFEQVNGLDFSSARSEYYPYSGAAPDLSSGDLQNDILRRDFSINALALSLEPANYGELIDLVDAQKDLADGVVRILHERSFADDPARLIRAVRFSSRFGFSLEAETLRQFQVAVNDRYLDRLPPARLYDEFLKALLEPDLTLILPALERNGIWSQLLPGIAPVRGLPQQLSQFPDAVTLKPAEMIFASLLKDCEAPQFEQIAKRFALNEKTVKAFNQIRKN